MDRKALAEALEAQPDVDLAVLFGSVATGQANARSDVDVGVLGALSPERLAALGVTLSRAAGRQVDLIALDTAPPLLRFEVARTGVVLVERVPHLWSDFKMRAMVDWWDWAPLARSIARSAVARLRRQAADGQG